MTSGVWAAGRRRLTVGLVLAITLVAFESLAVATILPVVARHLGDIQLYGWVFSAFMLASLVGIVVAGSLADRGALTGSMVGGLAFFAAGLLIGGLAPDMPVLVAGRAVQGLGAGVVPGIAYVAISRGYPHELRPRMFATLSTAWVVPGLVGPAVAAGVATTVGWRWVFLGLLPLVVVAGAIATLGLRSVAAPGSTPVASDGRRRAVAVAGVVAGAGALLAALTSGDLPLIVPGVVGGGVVMLAATRRLTPPGTLVARAGLPATILSRGLVTACFYAADAYVPFAVTSVRHASPLLAGAVLTAGTMTWTAGSWTQARTIHRVGPRRLVRSGQACVLVAIVGVSAVLVPAVPPAWAVVAWALAGFGMGLAYTPLGVTTLDRAPASQMGQATAGLQLTDTLGTALGTGISGAVVAASIHGLHLGSRAGVGLAFGIGAGVGVVALAVGRRLPSRLQGGGATADVATARGATAGGGTGGEGRRPAPCPGPPPGVASRVSPAP